jgi:hypothetical protein
LTAALSADPRPQGEYARIAFEVRNDGQTVAHFSGCPSAPSFHLEREELTGWKSINSSGIICLAIFKTERIGINPGGVLGRFTGVHKPGRYRIRLLVDGSRAQRASEVLTPVVSVP